MGAKPRPGGLQEDVMASSGVSSQSSCYREASTSAEPCARPQATWRRRREGIGGRPGYGVVGVEMCRCREWGWDEGVAAPRPPTPLGGV